MHYASQRLNTSRLKKEKKKSLTKRPLILLPYHLAASRTYFQCSYTILSSYAKPLLKTSSETNNPVITLGLRCFTMSTES